jgi:hypothetical protein
MPAGATSGAVLVGFDTRRARRRIVRAGDSVKK